MSATLSGDIYGPSSLRYASELFVNRVREERFIKDKVDDIVNNDSTRVPIINFWGAGGIGKTWILERVSEQYSRSHQSPPPQGAAPTLTIRYTFQKDSQSHKESEPQSTSPKAIARTLVDQLLAALGGSATDKEQKLLKKAHDQGDLLLLAKALNLLKDRFLPIVMLDNAEVVPTAEWQQILEITFIQPLSESGKIIVLIAGRRRIPRWRRFDVRRRTEDSSRTQVRAFDKDEVQQHIKQRHYPIDPELLYRYTAGNPSLIDAIGKLAQKSMEQVITDDAWFKDNQEPIGKILENYEERLLANVPYRLKPYLQMVAALRFYRLEALLYMKSKRERGIQQPVGHYLNVLNQLDRQTEVVWWQRGHKAFVTDDMVRRVMNIRLLLTDEECFKEQHTQALTMYAEWIGENPESSEDFIIEMWYHQASLYLIHQDEALLRHSVQKYLDLACRKFNLDGLLVICRYLHADDHAAGGDDEQEIELVNLLPNDLYNDMIEQILEAKMKLKGKY